MSGSFARAAGKADCGGLAFRLRNIMHAVVVSHAVGAFMAVGVLRVFDIAESPGRALGRFVGINADVCSCIYRISVLFFVHGHIYR